MLIGMARGIPGGVIGKGNSEGASKKSLVVFLFGDVLGHSFFFFIVSAHRRILYPPIGGY